MRRLFLLAAGIAAAIPFGAVPAHAEISAQIVLNYDRHLVPLDSGYELVVLCNASAISSDQTAVPTATAVSCWVNNGSASSRAMPGPEAYAVTNATVVGPYTICISGQAAFVDPVTNEVAVPSEGPVCQTWSL